MSTSKPSPKKIRISYLPLPSLPADGVLHCRPGLSKTNHAAAAECDMRVIVERFLKTGMLPVSSKIPQYGVDTTSFPYLQDALQHQASAKAAYARLPLKVRQETNNTPANLEPWLRDPRNTKLATDLGILIPRPPKPAKPAEEAGRGGQGGDSPPPETPKPKEKS